MIFFFFFIYERFFFLNDLWLTRCSFGWWDHESKPWHLGFIGSSQCQGRAHWGHLNTKTRLSVSFCSTSAHKYLTLFPYTVIQLCQIKIWKLCFYIWPLTLYFSAFQWVSFGSFLHGFIFIALVLLWCYFLWLRGAVMFLNIEKGMFVQDCHRRVQHGSQCHTPLYHHWCCCFNKKINKLIDY